MTEYRSANYYVDGGGEGGGSWGTITGDINAQTDLKNKLDSKQDTLVSGTNIKTIGGESLLGSGDIEVSSYHPSLLSFQWTDHILNEMSWLRADTFSWQSGDVYKAVYEHLVNDWNNYTTITNEQINSITNNEGTFVLRNCPDGHRITDDETAVARSYETGGAGWYFVLDIPNKRFKLPRTKWGFVGVRPNGVAGGYISESLPNITGVLGMNADRNVIDSVSGSFYSVGNARTWATNSSISATSWGHNVRFDASRSSSTYKDNAPVQQRATQMYLYFYVGEFSQTAIEQTAGYAQELTEKKADKNLANSTAITNCITEIPQDIKLELNNGTLTLKAGSKAYNGNGLFVNILSDKSISWVGSGQICVSVDNSGGLIIANKGESVSSLPSPLPADYRLRYNTTDKKCYYPSYGAGQWVECSLPIALATGDGTKISSIDQVFNGFGYVGSTVFALPGVKGLIPNGRNDDGSLKNNAIEVNNVLTTTDTSNATGSLKYHLTSSGIFRAGSTNLFYDEINNINKDSAGVKQSSIIIEENGYRTNGTTTTFTPKTSFHALDYNDKSTISSWGMPSNRYIDLTLGASGTTYTAPANGWVTLTVNFSSTNNRLQISSGSLFNIGRSHIAGNLGIYVPVKRGDSFGIVYEGTYSAVTYFRFIYAEGENS